MAFPLSFAGVLLLILFSTALIATALPLRLADPAWHLSIHDLLISNAPIAIAATCLGGLGLTLFPTDLAPKRNKFRFQRICTLLCCIYAAVLPCQLIAATLQGRAIHAIQQTEQASLKLQSERIGQRINNSRSLHDLQRLFSPPANQPQITLPQQKALLQQALLNDRLRRQNLSQTLQRNRLQRLVINTLRVVPMALLSSYFFWYLSDIFYPRSASKFRRHIKGNERLLPK